MERKSKFPSSYPLCREMDITTSEVTGPPTVLALKTNPKQGNYKSVKNQQLAVEAKNVFKCIESSIFELYTSSAYTTWHSLWYKRACIVTRGYKKVNFRHDNKFLTTMLIFLVI